MSASLEAQVLTVERLESEAAAADRAARAAAEAAMLARDSAVEEAIAGDVDSAARRKAIRDAEHAAAGAQDRAGIIQTALDKARRALSIASHTAEVENRLATMRHQRQDLDRIEAAIAETVVTLGRLAADRHAAAAALVSTCRWLRADLGESEAIARGLDGVGLATPEYLVKLSTDLHRDIGAAVGARTQPVAHADIRIPIFTASAN